MKIALLISIFLLCISLLNFIYYSKSSKKEKVLNRLKSENERPLTIKRKYKKGYKIKFSRWLQAFSLFSNFLGKATLEKIEGNLAAAGIVMKVEEAVAFSGILAIISGIIGTLIGNIIYGISAGIFTIFSLILVVSFIKTRRIKKMEKQLLDAVVLLSNSLRAGQSFIQALDSVSRETPKPLSNEFSQVMKENRIGFPIEDSLMKLSRRMKNKEVELLVTGVLIQRQVGGNLAEILDIIANTIEKRIKIKSKINTLTAQGRLSAWIVSLLPIVLGAFIYTINPELKKTMLEEPLGNILLIAGGIMLISGIAIIRKVVNIDV